MHTATQQCLAFEVHCWHSVTLCQRDVASRSTLQPLAPIGLRCELYSNPVARGASVEELCMHSSLSVLQACLASLAAHFSHVIPFLILVYYDTMIL